MDDAAQLATGVAAAVTAASAWYLFGGEAEPKKGKKKGKRKQKHRKRTKPGNARKQQATAAGTTAGEGEEEWRSATPVRVRTPPKDPSPYSSTGTSPLEKRSTARTQAEAPVVEAERSLQLEEAKGSPARPNSSVAGEKSPALDHIVSFGRESRSPAREFASVRVRTPPKDPSPSSSTGTSPLEKRSTARTQAEAPVVEAERSLQLEEAKGSPARPNSSVAGEKSPALDHIVSFGRESRSPAREFASVRVRSPPKDPSPSSSTGTSPLEKRSTARTQADAPRSPSPEPGSAVPGAPSSALAQIEERILRLTADPAVRRAKAAQHAEESDASDSETRGVRVSKPRQPKRVEELDGSDSETSSVAVSKLVSQPTVSPPVAEQTPPSGGRRVLAEKIFRHFDRDRNQYLDQSEYLAFVRHVGGDLDEDIFMEVCEEVGAVVHDGLSMHQFASLYDNPDTDLDQDYKRVFLATESSVADPGTPADALDTTHLKERQRAEAAASLARERAAEKRLQLATDKAELERLKAAKARGLTMPVAPVSVAPSARFAVPSVPSVPDGTRAVVHDGHSMHQSASLYDHPDLATVSSVADLGTPADALDTTHLKERQRAEAAASLARERAAEKRLQLATDKAELERLKAAKARGLTMPVAPVSVAPSARFAVPSVPSVPDGTRAVVHDGHSMHQSASLYDHPDLATVSSVADLGTPADALDTTHLKERQRAEAAASLARERAAEKRLQLATDKAELERLKAAKARGLTMPVASVSVAPSARFAVPSVPSVPDGTRQELEPPPAPPSPLITIAGQPEPEPEPEPEPQPQPQPQPLRQRQRESDANTARFRAAKALKAVTNTDAADVVTNAETELAAKEAELQMLKAATNAETELAAKEAELQMLKAAHLAELSQVKEMLAEELRVAKAEIAEQAQLQLAHAAKREAEAAKQSQLQLELAAKREADREASYRAELACLKEQVVKEAVLATKTSSAEDNRLQMLADEMATQLNPEPEPQQPPASRTVLARSPKLSSRERTVPQLITNDPSGSEQQSPHETSSSFSQTDLQPADDSVDAVGASVAEIETRQQQRANEALLREAAVSQLEVQLAKSPLTETQDLFSKMDFNKDGVITREEFEVAALALQLRDQLPAGGGRYDSTQGNDSWLSRSPDDAARSVGTDRTASDFSGSGGSPSPIQQYNTSPTSAMVTYKREVKTLEGVYTGPMLLDPTGALVKHGEDGTMRYSNGEYYRGSWVQDRPEGSMGVYNNPQGQHYTGPWRQGLFHGHDGKCTWPDGSCYEGPWQKGYRHTYGSSGAPGVMTWSVGEYADCRWEGPWFMDDMHGTGLWRSAEGTETQREYDRGDLVRESPMGRNTHSDE